MSETHDKITPNDISFILDNPWEITAIEWQLNDEEYKKNRHVYILEKLELATTSGYAKIWKTATNEPIAILGAHKVTDKKFGTFFVASKHMEEHALKLSFDMRQILKEQSYIYKGKGYSLGLYSESLHPKQVTWFRFLGFKQKKEEDRGDFKYFEYVPRVR